MKLKLLPFPRLRCEVECIPILLFLEEKHLLAVSSRAGNLNKMLHLHAPDVYQRDVVVARADHERIRYCIEAW